MEEGKRSTHKFVSTIYQGFGLDANPTNQISERICPNVGTFKATQLILWFQPKEKKF